MNWDLFGAFLYILLVVCMLTFHLIMSIKFNKEQSFGTKIRLIYNITGISVVLVIVYVFVLTKTILSIQSIGAITFVSAAVVFIWLIDAIFLFGSSKLRNYLITKMPLSEDFFRRLNRFYYGIVFGLGFLGLIILTRVIFSLLSSNVF